MHFKCKYHGIVADFSRRLLAKLIVEAIQLAINFEEIKCNWVSGYEVSRSTDVKTTQSQMRQDHAVEVLKY